MKLMFVFSEVLKVMFFPFRYFNIASLKLGGRLSETGQRFVGVLARELLLMGQRRPLRGAGVQKSCGAA